MRWRSVCVGDKEAPLSSHSQPPIDSDGFDLMEKKKTMENWRWRRICRGITEVINTGPSRVLGWVWLVFVVVVSCDRVGLRRKTCVCALTGRPGTVHKEGRILDDGVCLLVMGHHHRSSITLLVLRWSMYDGHRPSMELTRTHTHTHTRVPAWNTYTIIGPYVYLG